MTAMYAITAANGHRGPLCTPKYDLHSIPEWLIVLGTLKGRRGSLGYPQQGLQKTIAD